MTAPTPGTVSLGQPSSSSASNSKQLQGEEVSEMGDDIAGDSLEDRAQLLADDPFEEDSRTQ